MLRRIAKGTVIVSAVLLAAAFGIRFGSQKSEPSGADHSGGLLFLTLPAFAQAARADEFPYNEAGISAYVDMGQAIDLARSETAFSGIEASEPEYIIGSVELPNLAEDMWPHVYVGGDGWILAYYPKSEPTSRLVQWVGYQQDEITTTTLRDALVQVTQRMGLSTSTVLASLGYYHFQYPSATKLLIAVDTTKGTDTFTYTIPSGLDLYEASWSHYAVDAHSSYGTHTDIDTVRVYSGGGGTYVACGVLETQYTTPESAHEVLIYCHRNWAGVAIAFLHN